MVYVLKEPVEDSKGIIVFWEASILQSNNNLIKQQLERLSQKYVIGLYWASYQGHVDPIPFVDFHFAAPGTVEEFVSDEVFRVNFASRNFTPDYFRPLDIENRWDLCCIATPKKVKRLTVLLDVLRLVFNEKEDYQVLLLCPTPKPKEFENKVWDQEFFRKYEQEFSDSEKDNIDLHTPRRTKKNIQPVPNDYLPYVYNSSKAFTLFSQEEGGSKAISESLLCGTPVVVRSDLRGGGRDYLDDRNSKQFESINEAKDIFIKISEHPEKYDFDPTYLREELSEPQSVQVLENDLKLIFKEMGIPWKGEIEKQGLHVKLCGHTPTIPEKYRSHPIMGQLSLKPAAYKYMNSLIDEQIEELMFLTRLVFPDLINTYYKKYF